MQSDRQGNAISGAGGEAAAHFDQAVEAFNLYRGDPLGLLDKAIEASPGFVMAHALKAWFYALATEPAASQAAREMTVRAATFPATDRELSHLAALDCLLSGNWTQAAIALDRHTMRWPYDIAAIQVGHLLDFYRANARDLRDRIARVLPAWTEDRPGYSALLGMYAFGLEEAGDYARAEAFGRDATDRQPLDAWAHHAVAHVMEMQGRAEDGIGWMNARAPHWAGDDNYFRIHNWWHNALYHLELGRSGDVLSLYDKHIDCADAATALNLLDASAILWRVAMEGYDTGDRFASVARRWEPFVDGELFPFNDWHAAMAFLGAGRDADVDRLIGRYRSVDPAESENASWARNIGLPLIEGFAACWRGDHETAVARLFGARHIVNAFGGSHAQRDVADWTLTEAAIRGGMRDISEALANERLALRPHSPVNRRFLNRARTIAL